MNLLKFGDYPEVAILIKDSYFNHKDIETNYVNSLGLDCMAFSLEYINDKITAKQAKDYLKRLLPYLVKLGITHLYVADSTYFKVLTKEKKAEVNIGYALPCKLPNYEHLTVCYGINYGQLLYNDNLLSKLELSLDALKCSIQGSNNVFGDIIHTAIYNQPERLNELLDKPMLTIDIETTGLSHDSQIMSIALAWNEHEGMAFEVKDLNQLRVFFEKYKGHKIFHNASFDIKVIIFNCFMKHPNDIQGMLYGLHTMCKNLHDTKIIAYLATNNAQGNELGLKQLSQEFSGNYGIDNFDEVDLEYNLKDVLSTWFVFNKYYPLMLKDEQLEVYQTIMLPSLKVIIQMELIGMPINMTKVKELEPNLNAISDKALNQILSSNHIGLVENVLNQKAMEKYNSTHKRQKTIEEFNVKFNPNSGTHLQILLYEVMQLPVLAYTDTKQPSTDNKTLSKLQNHTDDTIIGSLLDYLSVQKIITTFVPALNTAKPKDGWYYLHGSFNNTGTLSGRWSSSKPNLQQIPSGSSYSKPIKECFQAPKGWIFCGADFNALTYTRAI